VLHGVSNLKIVDIDRAIDLGVRKFNLGRTLKQAYFDKLRSEIKNVKEG